MKQEVETKYAVCTRTLDPSYMVNYYLNWAKISWTYSTFIDCTKKIDILLDLLCMRIYNKKSAEEKQYF